MLKEVAHKHDVERGDHLLRRATKCNHSLNKSIVSLWSVRCNKAINTVDIKIMPALDATS